MFFFFLFLAMLLLTHLKAKTKRVVHFGLSSADLKSPQHKCALIVVKIPQH